MATTVAVARSAADKLLRLRALMQAHGFHAYLIGTGDAHNSEYIPRSDARREYVSGFTGSAGTAVVTATDARLWTDGRYYLQASLELDTGAGWSLMKDRLPETPSIEAWLASTLRRDDVVGVDPFLFTVSTVNRMRAALTAAGVRLCTDVHPNLVDAVWGDDKPAVPRSPVRVHALEHAGMSWQDKVSAAREALGKEGADALVVTALDEVAWLFNIRGADVECNPVTIAYGVVTASDVVLCIDDDKLTPEVRAALTGVTLRPYHDILAVVRDLAASGARLLMDPTNTNYALYQAAVAAKSAECVVSKMSPLQLAKAQKNEAERAGMVACHIRDGAALTAFFAWLEAAVTRGVDLRSGATVDPSTLTEWHVSTVLEGFRSAGDKFVGLSFPTIAGVGSNGAIIHYRPTPESSRVVTATDMFLCDSGAQYLDGTTDVTRTLHFGAPTPHQKLCYTRVLQGHIQLACATFPVGASGIALDALARSPLWRSGLDYGHGTGHGVGAYLNVHEGPFGAAAAARTAYEGGIKPYMTLTDEPGYYEDGGFGIRIENVMLAVPADTPHRFGGRTYLQFQTLTVAPITTRLVDACLLSPQELRWLNTYNAGVRTTLAPLLPAWALPYLERETAALAAPAGGWAACDAPAAATPMV